MSHDQDAYKKFTERSQTLESYVHGLLDDGKRSEHPDFQALFSFWGKGYITKIAVAHLNQNQRSTALNAVDLQKDEVPKGVPAKKENEGL